MTVLIVLLVLALILGGVGLVVKGLIWLVIIGALFLLAAIVWGAVKRAALFASRK